MRRLTFWHRAALALEKLITLVYRRHADYMLTMRLSGRAVEGRTNRPLSGVQVLFVDTSFDSRRAKAAKEHAIPVAETKEDGTFDSTFRYLWSADVFWLMISRIGNSFELHFTRDGSSRTTLTFNPWDLPYEENVLQVRVAGDIVLQPAPTRQ